MSAGVPCMHCISRPNSDAGRTPSGRHVNISSRGHSCACSFSNNQAEQISMQLYHHWLATQRHRRHACLYACVAAQS